MQVWGPSIVYKQTKHNLLQTETYKGKENADVVSAISCQNVDNLPLFQIKMNEKYINPSVNQHVDEYLNFILLLIPSNLKDKGQKAGKTEIKTKPKTHYNLSLLTFQIDARGAARRSETV